MCSAAGTATDTAAAAPASVMSSVIKLELLLGIRYSVAVAPAGGVELLRCVLLPPWSLYAPLLLLLLACKKPHGPNPARVQSELATPPHPWSILHVCGFRGDKEGVLFLFSVLSLTTLILYEISFCHLNDGSVNEMPRVS